MALLYFCIFLSVALNAIGWTLSFFHVLNKAAYSVIGLATLLFFVILGCQKMALSSLFAKWSKVRNRFKRPLPLAFLCAVFTVFLSALLFEPDSVDALSYRIPRALHWIHEQQWHWIETIDTRANTRTAGFEWDILPLLLFTHSCRIVSLFGILIFLCIPGSFFATMRLLGVSGRVAWYWMWILPLGYCFVLQAGNASNDLVAAVYALIALHFALLSVKTGRFRDGAVSILAAAMMVGTKQTTIPFVLPWVVAIIPAWSIFKRNLWKTTAILVLSLLISGSWILWNNWKKYGDWSGVSVESNIGSSQSKPQVNLPGNCILFVIQNFLPPYLPEFKTISAFIAENQNTGVLSYFAGNYESKFPNIWKKSTSDWCGLGTLVSTLILVSLVSLLRHRRNIYLNPAHRWILIAILISWAVILVAQNSFMPSRVFMALNFYTIPFILVGAHQRVLIAKKWWRILALITAWQIPFLLFFVFQKSPILTYSYRKEFGYYEQLCEVLAAWLRQNLPDTCKVVGLIQHWPKPEVWAWQPYGSRKVYRLNPMTDSKTLGALKIDAIILDLGQFSDRKQAMQWLAQNHFSVISRFERPYIGEWWLARREL